MDKNSYLSYLKSGNSAMIVHEYYQEKYDNKKHSMFLFPNDLINTLTIAGYNISQVVDKCVKYYDEKFNVVKVYKNDKLICVV